MLRQRLEASSWLALRAVAHSASSVQSVAAQGASWRNASTLLNLEAKSIKFATGGEHLNLKLGPRPSKTEDRCRHDKAQLQQLVRDLRFFVRRARRIVARSSGTVKPRMEKQQVGSRWRTLGFEVIATVEQSRRHLPSRQNASKKANLTRSLVCGACVVNPASFNSTGGHPASCVLSGKVLANQSLNRTHCSVPSFGLKKPSPNASPPQWAG